jgi:hypothetical protein
VTSLQKWLVESIPPWAFNADKKAFADVNSYLKINSPHKVSPYLACGMPVICRQGSAAAKEIEARKLGFFVNSLCEVPDTLARLLASAYDSMLGRVESMGRAVRQGEQLMDALHRAMLQTL